MTSRTIYRSILHREVLQRENIFLKHRGRLCSLISGEFYKYDLGAENGSVPKSSRSREFHPSGCIIYAGTRLSPSPDLDILCFKEFKSGDGLKNFHYVPTFAILCVEVEIVVLEKSRTRHRYTCLGRVCDNICNLNIKKSSRISRLTDLC